MHKLRDGVAAVALRNLRVQQMNPRARSVAGALLLRTKRRVLPAKYTPLMVAGARSLMYHRPRSGSDASLRDLRRLTHTSVSPLMPARRAPHVDRLHRPA